MEKIYEEKIRREASVTTELLTKKELSFKLKISQRKIELDKSIPCVRWGRSVRYDWQEVMAYLKEGGVSSRFW